MARHYDKTTVQIFFTLAVIMIWAFFDWLKKRGQSKEQGETRTAGEVPRVPSRSRGGEGASPAPPQSTRRTNWEEEMRRLLEGTGPAAPPAPVVVFEEPQPPPRAQMPRMMPAPPPLPVEARPAPGQEGLPVHFSGLSTSMQAYERASHLDVKVAEHLSQISEQVRLHSSRLKSKTISPDIVRGVSFVRNPQNLRSALIASVILGSPKALEN